jgi:hypothetical protein
MAPQPVARMGPRLAAMAAWRTPCAWQPRFTDFAAVN